MMSPELRSQILHFVRSFYVVRERQLHKFFSDWGEGEVKYCLTGMLANGELVRHHEKYISFSRGLPKPISFYEPCMDAIDVMAMLRSKKIVWLNRDEFPIEITFSTTDNVIYDVAVFDSQWIPKYSLIPRTRGKCLPPGEVDPVQHVAVVPNVELANTIDPLGFSLYAIIDRETGHAELFSLDE